MATLASRIQERASQFISEQTKLQSLQAELQIVTSVEKEEAELTQECARNLLDASHDRFGIERNLCEINEEIEGCSRLNTSIRSDAQRLEESARMEYAKMEEDIKNVYASHDSNIAVYCQALDSAIEHRRQRKVEDTERDGDNQTRITFLQIEEEQYGRDRLQFETEINRLEQDEIQSDRIITSLAKKVQDSLSKRVSLRQSLTKCQNDISRSDGDT